MGVFRFGNDKFKCGKLECWKAMHGIQGIFPCFRGSIIHFSFKGIPLAQLSIIPLFQ